MSNDDLRDILIELIDALLRKGTDQDGNWGFPPVREQLRRMLDKLSALPADPQP